MGEFVLLAEVLEMKKLVKQVIGQTGHWSLVIGHLAEERSRRVVISHIKSGRIGMINFSPLSLLILWLNNSVVTGFDIIGHW